MSVRAVLKFKCGMKPFADAFLRLCRLDENRLEWEGSPTTFSLITTQPMSLSISLQFMPDFFTYYLCHQHFYETIPMDEFSSTIFTFQEIGFSKFTFSYQLHTRSIELKIKDGQGGHIVRSIPSALQPTFTRSPAKIIDYTTFVIFRLPDFRQILTELNGRSALVTLTNSHITFKLPTQDGIRLDNQSCIIAGVSPGKRIQSPITLNPVDFYFNFTSEAEQSLWLFNSYDSTGFVLVATIGLYAQISSYFFYPSWF
ncbi:unnamed protein product [Citrullus colocynthis]|uniref:Uncharacterized protein n=1 Tax=Citrullus colocynthis TaxID=252529 RepID=A0ABP0Z4Z5_9ROSI